MPIPYERPPLNIERYTIDGTGVFVLTEDQRKAVALEMTIEMVLLEEPVRYLNFRYPEPQSFWGYVQLMHRDFVASTVQLEYRRQVLISEDRWPLEHYHQLRCMVSRWGDSVYRAVTEVQVGQGLAQEDAEVKILNNRSDLETNRLVPVIPVTSIWYELEPRYGGLLTIRSQGAATQCDDFAPIVIQAPPTAPAKGDSRPDAPGGGGQQPVTPPPPGRSSDPLSDSPAPPPDQPGGPPSPSPVPDAPAGYIMTVRIQDRRLFGSECRDGAIREEFANFVGSQGPGSVVNLPDSPGAYNFKIVDASGTPRLSLFSGSESEPCRSEILSIVQEPYY